MRFTELGYGIKPDSLNREAYEARPWRNWSMIQNWGSAHQAGTGKGLSVERDTQGWNTESGNWRVA